MARRILNRKDLRADYDAAERRKGGEGEEVDEAEVEDEEEDEDEEEGEGDEEAAEGEGEEGEESDEEEAPVKPKKKAKPVKPKAPSTRKPRAAKVVRKKVVWVVYNNSNAKIATYPYPQKGDAIAHAEKLTADKKNTHFVQPEKVDMEEKKEG